MTDGTSQSGSAWSVGKVAGLLGGSVVGDPEVLVTGLGGIDTANDGDLVFAENAQYVDSAIKSLCAAIITRADLVINGSKPFIIVDNPRVAFVSALQYAAPSTHPGAGIDPTAVIEPGAVIGDNVFVGPLAVIGTGASIGDNCAIMAGVKVGARCRIGANTTIHPNVVLYAGVTVGNNCLIHAGAIVGSDGFGFVPVEHTLMKVPHIGTVRIEDHVEIGANCCIDKAKTAETVIGAGTKLDNLVHVGHNVTVGRSSLLLAGVILGGSSKIGDGAILSGASVINDHISIGNGAIVGGNSGVRYDVPDAGRVFGTPAVTLTQRMREVAIAAKMPETLKQFRAMQSRLAALEAELSAMKQAIEANAQE